jgi:general secretion pathway protein D
MTFKAPRKLPVRALFSRESGGLLVILALGLGALTLEAGDGGGRTAGLANREVARREAMLQQANTLVAQGQAAEAKGDFVEAMKAYKGAYDMLPAAPMTASLKATARDGYSRVTVAQARKLAKDGRYDESRQLLATVLADDFNPDYAPAKVLLKQLDDPVRYEPAMSPQHKQNVEQVSRLLLEAHSFTNLGNFDAANEKYKDVLRIDPYNSAARRAMEKLEHEKSMYFDAARDHTRAKMLSEVSAGWEDSVPMDVSQLFGGGVSSHSNELGRESIVDKLRTWIVPVVDLQGASLDEVVEFLRIRSRDIDPKKRGISFVLQAPVEAKNKPVTLSLKQIPLEELLRYVTQMTGTAYHADEFAVTITSLAETSKTLIQRYYHVPPDFISSAPVADAAGAGAAPPDPFAKNRQPASQLQGLTTHRLGAREFLEQRGVAFPEGAAASYNPVTGILLVRNSIENLTQVEALVDQARSSAPKQVEIRVRLLDVDQTNMNELGFDWLLGQFNVPGSSGVFASGGTGVSGSDFPYVYPGTTTTANPGGTPVGQYSMTSGLRSSGAILGQPSIDSLIHTNQTPTIDSRTPGVFSVAGVFTDPQFQMVIRALSQKKGVDLMTAPVIIAKSGQRATVTVAREFPYPTEFNPPQIPTQIAAVVPGGGVNTIFGGANLTNPVVPTTPTAFAKRDVGINLEVEPVVDANSRLVHLNVVPSSTEFEGFVNYGSDIQSMGGGVAYTQPNPILQPIFRSNKTSTAVDIWDGQTLVMAGVLTEKRTDIEDKVPILGSLPVVGRMFQSKVSQTERKNVAFFVSVRIIDPAGNPVNAVVPTTASPEPAPVAASGP